MLVIVKNGPDTADGKRGVALAKDMSADVVLLQNGVYFARGGGLADFSGLVYVLEEDLILRGMGDAQIGKDIKKVGYDALVVLMAGSEKVAGMF
jgi:sulfur relay protein TusB/DsrH